MVLWFALSCARVATRRCCARGCLGCKNSCLRWWWPAHAALVEGPEEVLLTEAATLPMQVGDVTLHAGPQSFTQTNTQVAAQLYRQAAHWAAGKRGVPAMGSGASSMPGTLWDLYCGVGGFALHAAVAGVRQVVGVEVSPVAISSAQRSARDLWADQAQDLYCGVGGFALHAAVAGVRQVVGVEVSPVAISSAQRSARDLWADQAQDRARFIAADATAWAVAQDAKEAPDVVVVNPPRRGIGAELAGWLNECSAPRVIYSSCNPITLAKDLAAMPTLRVVEGRFFDMFPHTDHAEVAVVCDRV